MVLKLHGSSRSTCFQRVACTLHELNVPYELVPVDMSKGEHKSEEYFQKQPFGQVPYIDDEGFILFESRAICRYLAEKHGSNLIPSGLQQRALFEQAASIETSNFDPYVSGLVFEKLFKSFRGLATDEAVVKMLDDKLKSRLPGYERMLGKQKYLAGDELTLADLFHLPYGKLLADPRVGYNYLEGGGDYPNIARWWKDITSRPSWRAVVDEA